LCCEEAGTDNRQALSVPASSQHKAAPTKSDICSLRDSAAQKGWAISHIAPNSFSRRGTHKLSSA